MSNALYISELNPCRFYEVDQAAEPAYLSKHFDEVPFRDQRKPWNSAPPYFQKWQTTDTIRFQFTSNYSPINIQLIDKYGIARYTQGMWQVLGNKYEPGYYIFEGDIPLSDIDPGCYFIKIILPNKSLISEPLEVLVSHPNTLLIEYRNSRYHGDVIFETGIGFQFRLEGVIGFLNPGANEQYYEDQQLNPTVLSSKPFRSFTIHFGGGLGLPDWVVDKLNYIWSCNDVKVDGKSYAKNGESKFDITEQERYQRRGVNIDVREGANRGSKVILDGGNSDVRLGVVFNVEGKVFGDLSGTGSDMIAITSVE